MRAREDLTNVRFPMLNSHPKGEAATRVRAVLIEADGILSCIGGTFGNPTSTSDEN